MKHSRKILKEFLLFTVIPFLIPFILEIDEKWIHLRAKWLIVILVVSFDFYFAYKSLTEKQQDTKQSFITDSICHAYSGAYNILLNKKIDVSHVIEKNYINIQKEILPYDIHGFIKDICIDFKNVISSITNINPEFLKVEFIYRYTFENSLEEEQRWKRIIGKEPTAKHGRISFRSIRLSIPKRFWEMPLSIPSGFTNICCRKHPLKKCIFL